MNDKIVFFFGAGAEMDYDMGSGVEFIKPLLKSKYKEQIKNILGEDYIHYQLIHPNSKRIFAQTVYENQEEAEEKLAAEEISLCLNYYSNPSKLTKEEKDLFEKKCESWYQSIMNDTSDKQTDFFLNNACFFGSLDSRFNDLRRCPIGNNGKRVVNAYYNVFFHMLERLFNKDDILLWSFEEILEKLKNGTYENYPCKEEKTYYRILNRSDLKGYSIVTSNYTDLIEKEILKHDIVHLHGKLTWFEDYKSLQVYDITEDGVIQSIKDKDSLIPFIMIPSGVKPIICDKQIQEYAKFIDILKNTSVLIVLGYRFNSEDNHINAIIANWLRNAGKKMIYFNYGSETNRLNLENLPWLKDIIESGDKVEEIRINSENGYDEFEKKILTFR